MVEGESKKVDGVFEGGGVKGIGLVGAVAVTEEQGYEFENVAGTSAGAIVASLIAAGYKAIEVKEVLDNLDYNRFKDSDWIDNIPLVGKALSVLFENGIYEGKYFEKWLAELLAKKGIEKFGDLVMAEYVDDERCRYKLQVIATDISRGKLLILPGDIKDYGIDPDELGVAHAVRMSMSIPFFFEPVKLQNAKGETSYIVDGGVLSNYPVWLFDDPASDSPWPTFGYKLVEPGEGQPHKIDGPISVLAAMISTMMEAHDARYIKDSSFACTIPIPTLGVKTTEFDISRDRSEALYQSGVAAAKEFLARWDFNKFKGKYQNKPISRREQVNR